MLLVLMLVLLVVPLGVPMAMAPCPDCGPAMPSHVIATCLGVLLAAAVLLAPTLIGWRRTRRELAGGLLLSRVLDPPPRAA